MSLPSKTWKQTFSNGATRAGRAATTAYSYMSSFRGPQTQQLLVPPPPPTPTPTPPPTPTPTPPPTPTPTPTPPPTPEEYRENLNLIYKLFPSTPRFYINTGGTNEIKINFDHNDNNYFFIINNKDDGFKEILKLCKTHDATISNIIIHLNTIIRHLEQHNTILLSSNRRRSRTIINKPLSKVKDVYHNRMLNQIKNKLKNIIKKHNSLNTNAHHEPIVDNTLLNNISIRHITVVN